jgi:uncharacterized membrane protein
MVALLPRSKLRLVLLLLLSFFFLFAGVSHFTDPDFFVSIMPPYLPAHLDLVYLSGVFEILGGLGVLHPATRSFAGWGLIALLVAVFPANLHMALNPEPFVAGGTPLWGLYLRLPLQLVFIAWAWWATKPESAPGSPEASPQAHAAGRL